MARKISVPALVEAAGTPPKLIEEFIGRVNSGTNSVSVARMTSPSGWKEPGQTPEFDEYTVVLAGMLRVATKNESIEVRAGQAVIVGRGEWVQYSSPGKEGAVYIAICIPAFAAEAAHRDRGKTG